MRHVKNFALDNGHHIIAAHVMAVAVFLALYAGNKLGIGGIRITPWLLMGGLLLAEVGRSVMCFGAALKRPNLEYFGVAMTGLAWWLWSLDIKFLAGKHGLEKLAHFLAPAFLLVLFPVLAHYGRKRMVAILFRKDAEGNDLNKSADALQK